MFLYRAAQFYTSRKNESVVFSLPAKITPVFYLLHRSISRQRSEIYMAFFHMHDRQMYPLCPRGKVTRKRLSLTQQPELTKFLFLSKVACKLFILLPFFNQVRILSTLQPRFSFPPSTKNVDETRGVLISQPESSF